MILRFIKRYLYIVTYFIFILDIILLSLLFFRHEIMYIAPQVRGLYENFSIPIYHKNIVLSDLKGVLQYEDEEFGNLVIQGKIGNTSYRPSYVPFIFLQIQDQNNNDIIIQILQLQRKQIKGFEEMRFHFSIPNTTSKVDRVLGSLIYK